MEKKMFLAVISSYGTLSDPSHRYCAALMFSDKDTFFNLLSHYLKAQIEKAKENEEVMEELEEIYGPKAEMEIEEGIEEIKPALDSLMNNNGANNEESERRLIVTVPELLTDWHIEIFGSEKIEAYPVKDNKIGVLASDIVEGCGPGGEFLEVVQIVSPDEDDEIAELNYQLGTVSGDPLDAMSGIEKWNTLVGEGSIVEVIR